MRPDTEVCYIHKMALVKYEVEEPIPFAGIVKFVEYRCPMCQSTLECIEEYTTE